MGRNRIAIEFDKEYLNELTKDKSACVELQRHKKHVALQPFHLADFSASVKNILNQGIARYDKDLKGILLGYQNITLLNDKSNLINDSCFIHLDVEVDFFIFKPEVGQVLNGIVNKISKDHVGCLVHKTFNVSLPKSVDDDEDWFGNNVQIGYEISLCITFTNFDNRLPYLRAEFVSIIKKVDSGFYAGHSYITEEDEEEEEPTENKNLKRKIEFSDEETPLPKKHKKDKHKENLIEQEIVKKKKKKSKHDVLEDVSHEFPFQNSTFIETDTIKKSKFNNLMDNIEESFEETINENLNSRKKHKHKKHKKSIEDDESNASLDDLKASIMQNLLINNQQPKKSKKKYKDNSVEVESKKKKSKKAKKQKEDEESISDLMLTNLFNSPEDDNRNSSVDKKYTDRYKQKGKIFKTEDQEELNLWNLYDVQDDGQNTSVDKPVKKRKNKSHDYTYEEDQGNSMDDIHINKEDSNKNISLDELRATILQNVFKNDESKKSKKRNETKIEKHKNKKSKNQKSELDLTSCFKNTEDNENPVTDESYQKHKKSKKHKKQKDRQDLMLKEEHEKESTKNIDTSIEDRNENGSLEEIKAALLQNFLASEEKSKKSKKSKSKDLDETITVNKKSKKPKKQTKDDKNIATGSMKEKKDKHKKSGSKHQNEHANLEDDSENSSFNDIRAAVLQKILQSKEPIENLKHSKTIKEEEMKTAKNKNKKSKKLKEAIPDLNLQNVFNNYESQNLEEYPKPKQKKRKRSSHENQEQNIKDVNISLEAMRQSVLSDTLKLIMSDISDDTVVKKKKKSKKKSKKDDDDLSLPDLNMDDLLGSHSENRRKSITKRNFDFSSEDKFVKDVTPNQDLFKLGCSSKTFDYLPDSDLDNILSTVSSEKTKKSKKLKKSKRISDVV